MSIRYWHELKSSTTFTKAYYRKPLYSLPQIDKQDLDINIFSSIIEYLLLYALAYSSYYLCAVKTKTDHVLRIKIMKPNE